MQDRLRREKDDKRLTVFPPGGAVTRVEPRRVGTGTGKQRRVLTSQAVRVNQAPSPIEFVTLSTFLGAPCASVSSPVGFDDSEITCTHSKRLIKKKKKNDAGSLHLVTSPGCFSTLLVV